MGNTTSKKDQKENEKEKHSEHISLWPTTKGRDDQCIKNMRLFLIPWKKTDRTMLVQRRRRKKKMPVQTINILSSSSFRNPITTNKPTRFNRKRKQKQKTNPV